MQRSELAQRIAQEKCLNYKGEQICNEEFVSMVSKMIETHAESDAFEGAIPDVTE